MKIEYKHRFYLFCAVNWGALLHGKEELLSPFSGKRGASSLREVPVVTQENSSGIMSRNSLSPIPHPPPPQPFVSSCVPEVGPSGSIRPISGKLGAVLKLH